MPPRTFGGMDSDGAVDDVFWGWAVSQGIEAVKCAPSFFNQGRRGIAAIADIEPNEVILKVPGSVLISARSAERDHELKVALETHGQQLTSAERLACHLLHEASKGEGSKWHAYIQQLPRNYNLLCSWSEIEIAELQAPYAIDTASRSVQEMQASHQSAIPTLRIGLSLPSSFTTLRAWQWARQTISSRTVFVPFDSAGALCPVGDLFNYGAPEPSINPDVVGSPLGSVMEQKMEKNVENTTALEGHAISKNENIDEIETAHGDGSYDVETDTYCFYARRDYTKNQQIMLCYGKHTNLSLLEHYGFLLPRSIGNANDNARIEMQTDTEPFVTVDPNGILAWSDLKAVRMLHVSNSGALKAIYGGLKKARQVIARGESCSPEVELSTFEAVLSSAAKVLTELPTTAKDDESALSEAEKIAEDIRTQKHIEATCQDEQGAPLEWTREVSNVPEGDAFNLDFDENNATLAARWRLAYKRAVQAAYRTAHARCDEARMALGGSRGTGSVRDVRVSRPRLGTR